MLPSFVNDVFMKYILHVLKEEFKTRFQILFVDGDKMSGRASEAASAMMKDQPKASVVSDEVLKRRCLVSKGTTQGLLGGLLKENLGAFLYLLEFLDEIDSLAFRILCRSDWWFMETQLYERACKEADVAIGEGQSAFQAYHLSPPCCYICDFSIQPGGGRRWDVFVVNSFSELEYLIHQELNDKWSLYFLLSYGQDMTINVVQKGKIVQELILQEFIRLTFKSNKSTIWFEDVRAKASKDERFKSKVQTLPNEGLKLPWDGGDTVYTICCSPDYLCPGCSEHILADCECFQDFIEAESPLLEHLDFNTGQIPRLLGRPLRKSETLKIKKPLLFLKSERMINYGHVTLEGGSSFGRDWKKFYGST
jgi:hypothetical protein